MRANRYRIALITITILLIFTGCGKNTANSNDGSASLRVVAAQSTWGNLAAQLLGDKGTVKSIIANSNIDPHDYEPVASDTQEIAQAHVVVINGLHYDEWAEKAVDATPSATRQIINVGTVVGKKDGDNPHRWYAPNDVQKVVQSITDTYTRLRPEHARYFAQQRDDLLQVKLKEYNELRAEITSRFTGTPVGATESIAQPLLEDLKLSLITPIPFLDAVSEGRDPTTQDRKTAIDQLTQRSAKVLLSNTQNSSSTSQQLVETARSNNIQVLSLTETAVPEQTSFQDWQSRQLRELRDALANAR